jgi:hypothetical protein
MQAILETKIAAIDPSDTLNAILSDKSDEEIVDIVLQSLRSTFIATIKNARQLAQKLEHENE